MRGGRLSLAIVAWELIVRRWRFATTLFHQTIEFGKISTRAPLGKIIRSLKNGELFSYRTNDELIERRAVFSRDLLDRPLERCRQPERIVAACSHSHSPEDCVWGKNLYAEFFGYTLEMPHIEGRNDLGAAVHRTLQHHVIVGIPQSWPP